jgi:hypothetical protein
VPALRVAQARLSGPWRWLRLRVPQAVLLWMLGVCALSCRLFWRWFAAVSGKRRATPLREERWEKAMALLARRLRVSPAVELLQSALVRAPTVIGWLRPAILLPASVLTGLTPDQLEAVLAHELAHIRRRDYLVNIAQSVVEVLLFYHPAVWWVSHRIRVEREHCCDDVAVSACGSVVTYTRALAELDQLGAQALQPAMAASGTPLLERVRRLAGVSRDAGRGVSWVASVVPFAAVGALAISQPVPIQGRLLLANAHGRQVQTYYLSGDSSHKTYVPLNVCADVDLSPDGTRYVYSTVWDKEDGIHVCRADGTGDRLIAPRGCYPRWSPDGKRVVFAAVTAPGKDNGGCRPTQLFIVNADGTGLTQVTRSPGAHYMASWSPHGRYLGWLWRRPIANRSSPVPMVGRADGSESHALVGEGQPLDWADAAPVWSPDGRRVLLSWQMSDPTMPGVALAILGTVAPDGSDPQPILQCPIPARLSWWGPDERGMSWMDPHGGAWSPDGSQIAFLSAWHKLPEGATRQEREVYLVNADGTDLHRITFDATPERFGAIWRGPNTSPDRREVAVMNATVAFSSVAGEGLTTIIWDGSPPAPPTGYRFCSDCYNLSTTARYSGPITITMTYEDGEVPAGREEALALLRWNGEAWQDITTSRDAAGNTVRGETDSLSRVALAVR